MTDTQATGQPVTEAEAVANMALAAVNRVPVEVLDLDGVQHLFTTNARTSHGTTSVEHTRLFPEDAHGLKLDKPSRVAGRVVVETEDSLVAYVRDFKTTGTRLFANISANVIVAVLDYHEGRTDAVADMGTGSGSLEDQPDYVSAPDFGTHVAKLALPYSEQWETWSDMDTRMVSQVEFARFLLENMADVESPDGATLLELVKDLRGTRTKKFTGNVNLNAVADSFQYEDRQTVGAGHESVSIPNGFSLRLPVYFGGETVELHAQLRTDVSESGQLSLGFKLLRRESVRQATFQQLVRNVASVAGVPVVYGRRDFTATGQLTAD